MSLKIFIEEEIKKLTVNKYVKNVSKKGITIQMNSKDCLYKKMKKCQYMRNAK